MHHPTIAPCRGSATGLAEDSVQATDAVGEGRTALQAPGIRSRAGAGGFRGGGGRGGGAAQVSGGGLIIAGALL